MRVQTVKEGLYTSIVAAPNGKIVYLAFEELNDQTYRFWWEYNYYARTCVNKTLKALAPGYRRNAYKNPMTEMSAEAFKREVAQELNMKLWEYERFLDGNDKLSQALSEEGLLSGIRGLTEVFRQYESDQSKMGYMVYASKVPVKDYAVNTFPLAGTMQNSQDFRSFLRYRNLIMQFSLTTAEGSESTTHVGIYRNPMSYIEPKNHFRDISVLLHGFAAECSKEVLGKRIQVNKPTQLMADLMMKAVGREHVKVANGDQDLQRLNHVDVKGLLIGVELEHLAKPFQRSHDSLVQATTVLQRAWRIKKGLIVGAKNLPLTL